MKKRPNFEAFKKTAIQGEKFRTEYELLKREFEFIRRIIKSQRKSEYSPQLPE